VSLSSSSASLVSVSVSVSVTAQCLSVDSVIPCLHDLSPCGKSARTSYLHMVPLGSLTDVVGVGSCAEEDLVSSILQCSYCILV
jgi:hypothetical protein